MKTTLEFPDRQSEYKFLDYDYKIGLPVLVLAIKQDPNYFKEYNFKPGRKWLKIHHQTAGYACNQVYMDAIILTPKEPEKIQILNNEYLDSCVGAFRQTLNEVIKYQQRILELFEVDCNLSFYDLEEAIYPIDATEGNLRKICIDNLPECLDDLIEWGTVLDRAWGCINHWNIYILGENCD